jgi:hypothetical protein
MGAITKEERARRDKLAEQGIKVCYKCKEEKPFSEFNKNRSKTDGFNGKCRSCKKQYEQENKDGILEQKKQYYQKPEVKARVNNWHKEKRQSDPMFRLSGNISALVRSGFRQKGWAKDSDTQSMVGCSWNQAVLWLGDEPSKDMHIDHVIPQSLAETPEEIKFLNHYTNFQLLPAEENRAKGNRYIRNHNLKRVLAHHPQPDKLKEVVERSNVEII